MKDMPAALLVTLSKRDTALTHRVFDRVSTTAVCCATLFPDGLLRPVRPHELVVVAAARVPALG